MKKSSLISLLSIITFFLHNYITFSSANRMAKGHAMVESTNNLRLIQTNLPAYEAELNVDSLIADLQYYSANVLLINVRWHHDILSHKTGFSIHKSLYERKHVG